MSLLRRFSGGGLSGTCFNITVGTYTSGGLTYRGYGNAVIYGSNFGSSSPSLFVNVVYHVTSGDLVINFITSADPSLPYVKVKFSTGYTFLFADADYNVSVVNPFEPTFRVDYTWVGASNPFPTVGAVVKTCFL